MGPYTVVVARAEGQPLSFALHMPNDGVEASASASAVEGESGGEVGQGEIVIAGPFVLGEPAMQDWVLGLASIRFAMSTGRPDPVSDVVVSASVKSDDTKRLQLWQAARVSLTEMMVQLPLVEALGHIAVAMAQIQKSRPEMRLPVELRDIEYYFR